MDINNISNRAVEIYMNSNYGIKEAIARAKEEWISKSCKCVLDRNAKELFSRW